MRRIVSGAALALAAMALLPAFGSAQRASAEGKLVKVNGHKIFVDCVGDGPMTVVFENGLDDIHTVWQGEFDELSGSGLRLCRYDRFGVRPSGRTKKTVRRTLAQVVADERAMLKAVGAPKPYILVGHSIGGLVARYYNKRYPGDVAGAVLLESAPDDWDRFSHHPSFGEGTTTLVIAPGSKQLRKSDSFAAKPLIVIEAEDPSSVAYWTGRPVAEFLPYWDARQRGLAKLSSNSIFAVALNSGHEVEASAPRLVAEAVRLVAAAAQAGTQLPACAKSTLPGVGARCDN